VLGADGIVGAGQPPAAGAGRSVRRRGEGRVCPSVPDEGAIAEGGVQGAASLAAVCDLPVVWVRDGGEWPLSAVLAASNCADDDGELG
jgi:TPP-dependent pyruvate/acetoin dehydrogenase alpha subunit